MSRPFLRTISTAVGALVVLQTAAAAETGGNRDFARRILPKAADFPASNGRFTSSDRSRGPSGPADLVASTTTPRPNWRMCRECGYDDETPKEFKAVGLRANFQPIGGTFSYRF
ncbi:MAG: hypothetical protein ABW169_12775 [Sphingobium sp.]